MKGSKITSNFSSRERFFGTQHSILLSSRVLCVSFEFFFAGSSKIAGLGLARPPDPRASAAAESGPGSSKLRLNGQRATTEAAMKQLYRLGSTLWLVICEHTGHRVSVIDPSRKTLS
jgi:hypothetical protein